MSAIITKKRSGSVERVRHDQQTGHATLHAENTSHGRFVCVDAFVRPQSASLGGWSPNMPTNEIGGHSCGEDRCARNRCLHNRFPRRQQRVETV